MTESKFIDLTCCRCGGQLKLENDNTYQCKSCGKTFEKQVAIDVADQLRIQFDEQKQEAVANLRRQLWAEMHEQYINSEKIVDLARDIKKYLPEDYFANFCEIANSGNDKQVNDFLNNTPQSDMADYADVVLDFMLKSMTAANLTAISLFIERAFKGDTQSYDKYINRYEQEAQKVNSGIYELILTRDVFLAYSSADIEKVLELCEYLESNNITCFLALRNLRHGRGAVDNYDRALQTAIDNCKTVVFVSSTNSRSLTCDALTKELPYIRQKDIDGAPAEYKRAYDKMPAEYMMPRVEYLIEDYTGSVAEMMTKEFFHSLEWCKSKEAVAARISKYLTETHKTVQHPQSGTNVDYETLAAIFAEEQRKIAEEQRKVAEEQERKRREEQRKIAEEQEIKRRTRRDCEIEKHKDQFNNPPFNYLSKYKGHDSEIIIPAEVTCIGWMAFSGCSSVKSVVIPEGVRFISEGAFSGCRSLTCITIPNSVESIDKSAFSGCESLTNITIPNNVTSIGENAFGFSGLKNVTIPNSVITIGVSAFGGCRALTSINVSSDNKKYKSVDGNLYSFDGKKLIQYAIGKTEKSFTIPNSVTFIGDYAFSNCTSLTSITIPNSVTSIGEFAFSNCTSLTSITIPNSVTSIRRGAFSSCRALKSITIPKSVTNIGEQNFYGCDNLNTIYCRTKKPLFGLPKGWNKYWLGGGKWNCKAQVVWDYKGN